MINAFWSGLFVLATLKDTKCKIINPAILRQKYRLERPLIVGDEIKAIGIWYLEHDPDWAKLKNPKFK